MRVSLLSAAALVALLPTTTAWAHLRVTSPTTRYGDSQKAGPCGIAGGARSDNVHTFAPGETITIVWDEFIDHPGHYRISFDPDGDDDFVDPAAFDDFYSAPSVLVDNIPDKQGGTYTYQLELPDVECDNCTLQVIQMMTDKPPYGDGNDIYYQCIDLILSADAPGEPGGPDAGPGDPGDPGDSPNDPSPPGGVSGGCAVGAGAAGGLLPVLVGLGALLRRRRRG